MTRERIEWLFCALAIVTGLVGSLLIMLALFWVLLNLAVK